jgi:glycerophosphoryl diester phosphodiesterase
MISPDLTGKTKASFLIGKNITHRGLYNNKREIPENSLEAAKQSIMCGFGMEFDIQLSRDNKVIVFHDDDLWRMTGIDKKVNELTYRELTDISLLNTKQTLPTLEQFLEIADGKVPLIIELKKQKSRNTRNELCHQASSILDKYNGKFVVESFDPEIVAWFRRNRPDYIRGQLACNDNTNQNIIERFALAFLLLNFYTRPHFIAYEHSQTSNISFYICKMLGALTVGWTIKSIDDYKNAQRIFDTIIFENILPANGYAIEKKAKNILSVTQNEIAAEQIIEIHEDRNNKKQ